MSKNVYCEIRTSTTDPIRSTMSEMGIIIETEDYTRDLYLKFRTPNDMEKGLYKVREEIESIVDRDNSRDKAHLISFHGSRTNGILKHMFEEYGFEDFPFFFWNPAISVQQRAAFLISREHMRTMQIENVCIRLGIEYRAYSIRTSLDEARMTRAINLALEKIVRNANKLLAGAQVVS